MYENEIIEMENFSFNHYIHHFEDSICEDIEYKKEHDCMAVVDECFEDLQWEEGYKYHYKSII